MPNKSKFEEVFGNLEAFQIMLDGVFKDWDGSYDVLLTDTGDYLSGRDNLGKRSAKFRPLCRALRRFDEGERRCAKFDRKFSEEVALDPTNPDLQIRGCHINLFDIAVPIVVDGNHLATIFCGQVRSTDVVEDNKHKDLVKKLEHTLDIDNRSLQKLSDSTPQISTKKLEEMRDRISVLINYITELGAKKQQLNNNILQKTKRDEQRVILNSVLEDAAISLFGARDNWESFWDSVTHIIQQMLKAVGGMFGTVIVPNNSSEKKNFTYIVKVATTIDASREVMGDIEIQNVPILQDDETENKTFNILSIDKFEDDFFWNTIKDEFIFDIVKVTQVAIISLDIVDQGSYILFFMNNDDRNDLNHLPVPLLAEEEKRIFIHLATLISVAHRNTSFFQRRKQWLKQVSHQLISPLHGIQGYAEVISTQLDPWSKTDKAFFDGWDKEDFRFWNNTLKSVIWTTHYAARLAHNLAWVAYLNEDADNPHQDALSLLNQDIINLTTIGDMGGFIIAVIRDFQGMAKVRRQNIVVSEFTFDAHNGRVRLSEDLIRQVLGNVLDNAVKYSKKDSRIIVKGDNINDKAIINIINIGFQLHEKDIEKIFDYQYRTYDAERRHVAGTGIGLFVARQMTRLHKGDLKAFPSKKVDQGWETTFQIILPLREL